MVNFDGKDTIKQDDFDVYFHAVRDLFDRGPDYKIKLLDPNKKEPPVSLPTKRELLWDLSPQLLGLVHLIAL